MFLILAWTVAALYAFAALLMIYMRPSNIGSIVSVLSAVFVIPPILLYVYHGVDGFYSFRNVLTVGDGLFERGVVDPNVVVLLFIMLAFSAGAFAGSLGGTVHRIRFVREEDRRLVNFLLLLLLLLWLVILYRVAGLSQGPLWQLFLPARTSDVSLSYYENSIFMSIPAVMLLLEVSRRRPRKIVASLIVVMGIATCLTTPQRRELVVFVLTACGAYIFLSDREWAYLLRSSSRSVITWQRGIVFRTLGLGAALVPIAWYARSFSTNLLRGDLINPFAVRNVFELLMGSPATGFPTFTLISDYVSSVGVQPAALFTSLVTMPIPRSIMTDKPIALDNILHQAYELPEVPSVFWFGELFFNYGYAAPLAALAWGFLLAALHRRFSVSGDVLMRGLAVIIFANAVTFFKNGFLVSIGRAGITMAILVLVFVAFRLLGGGKSIEAGR